MRNPHETLPTGSEGYYEKEFISLVAKAGKYTMQDTIVSNYLRYLKYGKRPPKDEPSFRWTYKLPKDSIYAYILNKDGEIRGKPMISVRLD